MASFQLLDQREEDELHKSRLLNVEEKPFKRITKRLLTPGSLLTTPSKLLTPPPEDEGYDAASEEQKITDERQQFRKDVLLDFAAFDSSIARIQFLRNSNEQERERYRADKERILATAQEVRDNTAILRVQLEEAKATLAQRQKFDKLAEKITNNKLLRPREDQVINLMKLEEECRELERESGTYAETWRERRAQFERIVEEGNQLRRLIRDEKEEVERREGMDGGEEDGEVGEGSRGGQTPKHISGSGTPRPDRPESGSGDSPQTGSGLKPKPAASSSLSRPGSRAPSPAVSEMRKEEDVAMGDTPMADTDAPAELESSTATADKSGEAEPEDKMDTT